MGLAMVIGALALAAPASAQSRYYGGDHSFRFWLGVFQPTADSQYWNDAFDTFTGEKSDFDDTTVGADFKFGLTGRTSLLLGGSYYEGTSDQSYRDYVDSFGNSITHTTRLDVAAATAAFVVDLTGRQAVVVPYVGVGGGFYAWRLEENGDFIDFTPADPTVFSANFSDDGTTLGWFWLAGVDIPIGPRWSVFAEGRWQHLENDLGGDFSGLGKLDLAGRSITGGVAWRF
jgi:opacity protein-like surface antigen